MLRDSLLVEQEGHREGGDTERGDRTHQGKVDLETAAKLSVLSHAPPPYYEVRAASPVGEVHIDALALSMA